MLVQPDNIAKVLNVNRATVYRMLKNGKLRNTSLDSVVEYIINHTRKKTKRELIDKLKEYGWIRRSPTPSSGNVYDKKFNPWKDDLL